MGGLLTPASSSTTRPRTTSSGSSRSALLVGVPSRSAARPQLPRPVPSPQWTHSLQDHNRLTSSLPRLAREARTPAEPPEAFSVTRTEVALANVVLVHELVSRGHVTQAGQVAKLVHDDRAGGSPTVRSLQNFTELGSVEIDGATDPVLLRRCVVRRPGGSGIPGHTALQLGNH